MKTMRLFLSALLVLLASAAVATAQTKIIDNGPDASKKVMVVLGDGYAAGADQTKFNTDVDNLLKNGVFGNDFFKENQNAFNVYRFNLISAESGVSQKVYNENGTPNNGSDDTVTSTTIKNTALKYIWSGSWAHCWLEGSANTEALIQAAIAPLAKVDYLVIILNQDSYGGCGGGGRQVVPRGVTWPVLAHEFGHGVGGLSDEYFNSGTSWTGGLKNGPNCSTVLNRNTVHWNRFIDPATALPTVYNAATMDSNETVGMFEGCGTKATGIYRPVHNCRMRGNTPEFCPVCYTHMKGALKPYLDHDYLDSLAGDFTGDGKSDVLIHNGKDLAIYRRNPNANDLSLHWIANNIVPAAVGGTTWQPAEHDQYYILDFNGDGKDDVVVFNGSDWVMPYLGLLRSTGSGLECIKRYDDAIGGFWDMTPGDKFYVGDFSGDGKDDLFIFNGTNWSMTYLGLLRSTGTALAGEARHDGNLPGWSLQPGDKFFPGDFDADGKTDLYVSNVTNWGPEYLGMLKSSGTSLSRIKLFTDALPGWTTKDGDKFYVGDFNGDGKADLYVFNGTDWAYAYLLMVKSTGTDLSFVERYDSSSAAANIPGWEMRKHDSFYVSDANKDGKSDLFVFNTSDWATEYLGTLRSTSTGLSGSWSADWVGGWNLGSVDKILVANYEGGAGKPDIFIRNANWFGLLRKSAGGFVMDRIYHSWIYTAQHDSKPWSDTMP